MSERKGSDVFVEAAAKVRRARPDVEFRLIGANDPTAPGYGWGQRVLEDAAGAGIVHVPRADAFAELAGWDLIAMPSRFDPYPLSVMEAMASGVPVVGSAVDGIAEQVTADTGVLVAPGNAEELAGAILELLADGPRRRAMAAAARARAREHFTLERQADALEAAWNAALDAAAA